MAELVETTSSMSLYARLGGKLGVARISSDRDLASLVEKRLPASVIKSLVRAGLSDAEVYRLIIPRRTLAHRAAPSRAGDPRRGARLAAGARSAAGSGTPRPNRGSSPSGGNATRTTSASPVDRPACW